MDDVTTHDILAYLKEHMPTKSEVLLKDELEERFRTIEARFEKIEAQLAGTNNRIDALADAVAPVQKLIPLITDDFYKRFVALEAKVNGR